MAREDLPGGTVTFLFTDIEGSTKLLHELGAEAYSDALAEHRRTLREAFARNGGVEVDTQGDAFFYAFPDAKGAAAAAAEAQERLASGPIQVRMGIHTGEPYLTEEGYVGEDVHKGARIASAGHGSQVLLSKETRELVELEVADLGEHRVKDFSEPVWIFQLGRERFPPLKTISNTNLPRPASSFVGREREVAEVVSLLRDDARLLTLTGPGGSGKTRLGIEAAAELVSEFRNGVFWVGLAALRDPALVTETVAQTVGAKDGLAEHIGEREMLLLLDNFEQVVDAAPGLSPLLQGCPSLRVLVTSRELLRIQGEVEYAVPPLAEPEAAELFRTRSGLAPDETIAELCRRLDNLPLAVELAAARTRVLSPAQILERLSKRLDLLKGGRDAEVRQRTLRATIEWSFDLLSAEEKELFARLAVFGGGCTLASAEAVAEADLDVLQSLVDKSLLRHTEDRFWMLETIREYALERLEESREAEDLRRGHAEHLLSLAEEAEPHLREEMLRGGTDWFDRLEREVDNLRGALDWLEGSSEGEAAQRLAGASAEFWCGKEHVAEGRRRLESALQADGRPTAARAKALIGAAHMARDRGNASLARIRAEEALALYQNLEDARGTALAMFWIAQAVADEGDFVRGRQLHEKSARLFRELGDEYSALMGTRMLAWMFFELGDMPAARALHEANLERARALRSRPLEVTTLGALTEYAARDGRIRDAVRLASELTRLCGESGDRNEIAVQLCRGSAALAVAGKAHAAARLLSCSEALHEEMGLSILPYLARANEGTLQVIRSQLDETALAEAWEEGRKLTTQEAVALALAELGDADA
ncbi:MAG TPA: adenylate/guanylate cyclase domain-containing protein [Actinomycetota bacterium]|nr:adenylate/guanylate cyclase domain-containing protein [Actinomycetota bacterium]